MSRVFQSPFPSENNSISSENIFEELYQGFYLFGVHIRFLVLELGLTGKFSVDHHLINKIVAE
jgi:hypothetical protein